jgi:hypothetical protein
MPALVGNCSLPWPYLKCRSENAEVKPFVPLVSDFYILTSAFCTAWLTSSVAPRAAGFRSGADTSLPLRSDRTSR